MNYEIIDFHTHPFVNSHSNICKYKDCCNMSVESTAETMKKLGVSKICGSVINSSPLQAGESRWDRIRSLNDEALKLNELYGDFYIPGFHVHPDFVAESIGEIDSMHAKGVNLIGELVPYSMGYTNFNTDAFNKIIDHAGKKDMVVSLHTMPDDDDFDAFVASHPMVTIIGAHPGEKPRLLRHIERLKKYKNYYLDLSGTGIFRHGTVRKLIDEVGAERILFGSDYPTCSPAMFVGAILLDELITPREKQLIFSENVKRLLKIQ